MKYQIKGKNTKTVSTGDLRRRRALLQGSGRLLPPGARHREGHEAGRRGQGVVHGRRREVEGLHLRRRGRDRQPGADPLQRGLLGRAAEPGAGGRAEVPRLLHGRARHGGRRLRRLRRGRARPPATRPARHPLPLLARRLVHGRRLRARASPTPRAAPGSPSAPSKRRTTSATSSTTAASSSSPARTPGACSRRATRTTRSRTRRAPTARTRTRPASSCRTTSSSTTWAPTATSAARGSIPADDSIFPVEGTTGPFDPLSLTFNGPDSAENGDFASTLLVTSSVLDPGRVPAVRGLSRGGAVDPAVRLAVRPA